MPTAPDWLIRNGTTRLLARNPVSKRLKRVSTSTGTPCCCADPGSGGGCPTGYPYLNVTITGVGTPTGCVPAQVGAPDLSVILDPVPSRTFSVPWSGGDEWIGGYASSSLGTYFIGCAGPFDFCDSSCALTLRHVDCLTVWVTCAGGGMTVGYYGGTLLFDDTLSTTLPVTGGDFGFFQGSATWSNGVVISNTAIDVITGLPLGGTATVTFGDNSNAPDCGAVPQLPFTCDTREQNRTGHSLTTPPTSTCGTLPATVTADLSLTTLCFKDGCTDSCAIAALQVLNYVSGSCAGDNAIYRKTINTGGGAPCLRITLARHTSYGELTIEDLRCSTTAIVWQGWLEAGGTFPAGAYQQSETGCCGANCIMNCVINVTDGAMGCPPPADCTELASTYTLTLAHDITLTICCSTDIIPPPWDFFSFTIKAGTYTATAEIGGCPWLAHVPFECNSSACNSGDCTTDCTFIGFDSGTAQVEIRLNPSSQFEVWWIEPGIASCGPAAYMIGSISTVSCVAEDPIGNYGNGITVSA